MKKKKEKKKRFEGNYSGNVRRRRPGLLYAVKKFPEFVRCSFVGLLHNCTPMYTYVSKLFTWRCLDVNARD